MRRVLLLPIGSSGDVNPFLWIGRHLSEYGYEVSVAVNPFFADTVISAKLRYIPIGTEEEYHSLTHEPNIWHPIRGTPLVMRYAGEITERYFNAIQAEAKNDSPLLLAPATAFGARLAREKLGLTLISVNLQPSIFRSVYQTAYFGRGFGFLQYAPRWIKRTFFSLIDDRINREITPGIARACLQQEMQPSPNAFRDWWQSPDGSICLFPEWFAALQPDWPLRTRCIGFPLEDLIYQHTFNAELETFLNNGPPPVLFTLGTAMTYGQRFFQVALSACESSGLRALFITRYPKQLPTNLPSTIRHFSYLPFSSILPRCTAIVHHGGIGTTSQALAAGLPQLIMPLAHDQPDNAMRIRKLGVGTFLWPHEFNPDNVIRKLATCATYSIRASAVAKGLNLENPSKALLDFLTPYLR